MMRKVQPVIGEGSYYVKMSYRNRLSVFQSVRPGGNDVAAVICGLFDDFECILTDYRFF